MRPLKKQSIFVNQLVNALIGLSAAGKLEMRRTPPLRAEYYIVDIRTLSDNSTRVEPERESETNKQERAT
jgi:hypothetical protein